MQFLIYVLRIKLSIHLLTTPLLHSLVIISRGFLPQSHEYQVTGLASLRPNSLA